jgi:hypothetical protein
LDMNREKGKESRKREDGDLIPFVRQQQQRRQCQDWVIDNVSVEIDDVTSVSTNVMYKMNSNCWSTSKATVEYRFTRIGHCDL